MLSSTVLPLVSARRSSWLRALIRQGSLSCRSATTLPRRTEEEGFSSFMSRCERGRHDRRHHAAAWPEDPPTHHGDHPPEDRRIADGVINQFELLGLPTVFQIDEQQLKTNYLKLMVESHPDKLVSQRGRSPTTPTSAAGNHNSGEHDTNMASMVTKAFDVLQKPHTRAQHLLELAGRPLEEAATASLVGLEFLTEIMEWRESIQATSDQRKLHEWRDRCRDRTQETCRALAEALDAHDGDAALERTAQLQYWNRVDETLRDKMDTLE